jgi:hypothetical protein
MVERNRTERDIEGLSTRSEDLRESDVKICEEHGNSLPCEKCVQDKPAAVQYSSAAVLGAADDDLPAVRSVNEEEIADGLRLLTDRLEELGAEPADGDLGEVFVYGTFFENDIFGIHPHCSCGRDSCSRCLRCTCPDNAFTYLIESEEVDAETFFAVNVEKFMTSETTIFKDSSLACDLCSGKRVPSPNFWHKTSGTKISWYVSIGRKMAVDLQGEWTAILSECLTSIQRDTDKNL